MVVVRFIVLDLLIKVCVFTFYKARIRNKIIWLIPTYFDFSMTVEDHNDMQETFSMADHDDHKIQIINVPSHGKMKKAGDKSTFDPSVIPDDIASNTLNIDHGYFLSFLPQQKSKNKTLLHHQSSKCENIYLRLGILKTSRKLSI